MTLRVRRLSVALTPTQAVLLLASMATALALRLHGLDADLNHDEAFTWQSFASQPYGEIVSAYPVPNNHIFHSILVRIASRIFGAGEIAIRLPALLAGLAAIPAVFLLGRALFQRTPPALLAAWILALSPAHISFSQVARGYSLLLLFASLSFLCLHRAIQHRESGSGLWWVGSVCFSFFSCLYRAQRDSPPGGAGCLGNRHPARESPSHGAYCPRGGGELGACGRRLLADPHPGNGGG